MLTVGKADLDMAAYGAADKGAPQAKMIPIVFKVRVYSVVCNGQ